MVPGRICAKRFSPLVVIQVCSLYLELVTARVGYASVNRSPILDRYLELFPRSGVNSFMQNIPTGRTVRTPGVNSLLRGIPTGRTARNQSLEIISWSAQPSRIIHRLRGSVPSLSRRWGNNPYFLETWYQHRQLSRAPTTETTRNAGEVPKRSVDYQSVVQAPRRFTIIPDNYYKTSSNLNHRRTSNLASDLFEVPNDVQRHNFTSPLHGLPSFDQAGSIREIWSYGDSDTMTVGPNQWHRHFPSCGHGLQSPIDISGNNFQYSPLAPITMHSLDSSGMTEITISNNGFTATITPLVSTMYIDCDDLPGTYILSGIHFHWGSSDFAGSEHLMHGKAYPLEMHLVSYNSIYGSLLEAEGKQDGVHVLAIFFEMFDRDNFGLNFCIEKLRNVKNPGAEIKGELVNISRLLPPANSPYYRYVGSLTTPPCTENIIWSVYSTPQAISSQQLAQFRYLTMSTNPDPYTGGNVRPLQPLENRVILTNDPTFIGWK